MPVDPTRVQAVFLATVRYRNPADRAAVLDRECPNQLDLRQRVESLLRANDQADGFLDQPIVSPADWFGVNFTGIEGGMEGEPHAGSSLGSALAPLEEPERSETVKQDNSVSISRVPWSSASAPTSCSRSSARGAWASSTWLCRRSRSNAGSRSRSLNLAWIPSRSSPDSKPNARPWP